MKNLFISTICSFCLLNTTVSMANETKISTLDNVLNIDFKLEKSETSTKFFTRALQFFQAGNLPEAKKALEISINLNPLNEKAHFLLGNIFLDESEPNKAINEYNQCISINPDNSDFYVNLGIAFYELGEFEQSIELYQKALKINPYDVYAYTNLGNIYSEKGMKKEAIEQYESALKIDPENLISSYNLGSILIDDNKLAEAVTLYKNVLKTNPDHGLSHYNLGLAYYKQENLFEATNEFTNACLLGISEACQVKIDELEEEDQVTKNPKLIDKYFISYHKN